MNQIELYDEQIVSIDQQLKEFINDLYTSLKSVTGLNDVEIAVMTSVTNNFNSPSKILAYSGLEPVVRQSGKWQAKTTRMSK